MSRKQKILHCINKSGKGLEIGASHRPSAAKKEGYDVEIIDHASREELIEKYRSHKVNIGNIEEVDYIWKGQSYKDLTGKENFYDWIIASHVIEHTPDLIAFINDCDSLLKADGVISLAIPDKRYCFDHFRPLSGLARVIDNHLHKTSIHTPGEVAEYFLNVVAKNKKIAWKKSSEGRYTLVHPIDHAKKNMDAVLHQKAYVDLHSWCFTPSSFRLIIHDLNALGFISLSEVAFFPTVGSEFFITLGHREECLKVNRLQMLKAIESEICEGIL